MSFRARKQVRVTLILACLLAVGLGIIFFQSPSPPPNPVMLKFLGYTNVDGQRLASFEITNKLPHANSWSFNVYTEFSGWNPVATTLWQREARTQEKSALKAHTSLRFVASPDLRSGDSVFICFSPMPGATDNVRTRISNFLINYGWVRAGVSIDPKLRLMFTDGLVLP